jgi:hypothetical protein
MNTRTRNHQEYFVAAATILLVFSPMLPALVTVGVSATMLAIGIALQLAAKPARRETST